MNLETLKVGQTLKIWDTVKTIDVTVIYVNEKTNKAVLIDENDNPWGMSRLKSLMGEYFWRQWWGDSKNGYWETKPTDVD